MEEPNTQLAPLEQLGLSVVEQYKPMLSVIDENRLSVSKALKQHGKSHTQFQYTMLDNAGPIAGPTKLRNMRQILAVIDQTESALNEAWFRRRKKQVEALQLRKRAETAEDDLEREMLEIEAEEIEQGFLSSEKSIGGAIRKLAAYYEQYRELEAQLKEELGKEEITEADFEADEERFHIMKAFEQAMIAGRANGRIDHGNMIYLHDIGVSGVHAQQDIMSHLARTLDYARSHPENPVECHKMDCEFLDAVAKKYSGSATAYAKRKGLRSITQSVALLRDKPE